MDGNGRGAELPRGCPGFSTSRNSRPARPAPKRSPGSAPRVVKVENPKGGEPGRVLGTGPKPGADAYYFMIYNANKKSVTVNLKSERGLALVKEMAKSRRRGSSRTSLPGAIERLGARPGRRCMHSIRGSSMRR